MEKIQKRELKWLWLPYVLMIPASIIGGILGLIPIAGIVFAAIFGVVTMVLGLMGTIYKIYFYYQLSLDVNAVCKGDGAENKSYLYVLALNVVTFGIYGRYWVYKIGQRLQANAPRYGFKMIVGGKELVVLDLLSFGWISAWELVKNMNKFAGVYNIDGVPNFKEGEGVVY